MTEGEITSTVPTSWNEFFTVMDEFKPSMTDMRYRVPDGAFISGVRYDLVIYSMNKFQVDGVEYDRRDASPYAGPMLQYKPAVCDSGRQTMRANWDKFRTEKLHNEWKDLEWDPTIRL